MFLFADNSNVIKDEGDYKLDVRNSESVCYGILRQQQVHSNNMLSLDKLKSSPQISHSVNWVLEDWGWGGGGGGGAKPGVSRTCPFCCKDG